ncbi:FAD-containing oxidoreductase [Granulicella sibirica]|uniref:PF00070 family, FAD-dependent NAD(P)-disulfide oxidoreductase n=1 Tax=Granulicella sibirica TaxID=2479048 RepID=A0A4Q0SYM6_9BACT|nr:FAD-containing oxidoreductase [Granulicella sibirica]RXH56315.1 PF00070 family, FAD-dependent NAD(P)-disulfide oxidoreductase [Granulicella sibirica]
MKQRFDAIILGAGQAGPPLAGRLTQAGWKVALVERKLFGGTCVNVGCTPTKALVASAHAAHLARRGGDFGVVSSGPVRMDMAAVKARKDKIVAKSRNGVEGWLRKMEGCTVFTGTASFTAANEVRVGEEFLEADHIFVNVGARPFVPPAKEMPGTDSVPFLTSSTILELDELPKHLVVVGGSYIGLEFAQMYRRFGAEVTVVERKDRLVPHEDEDVSAAVLDVLEAEGIQVRLDACCIALSKRGDEVVVGVECVAGHPEVVGSHVLLGIGRVPNTDDLGLAHAGVTTDEHGFIVVDDQLRTNVPGIWAMGDCNGRGAFTHTSYNDFEIVAANLLDADPRRVSDRIQVHALYIDPPLAQIGMTEAEVRASGKPALMGTRPMTKVGRAVEKGETKGFMKVLVDAETKMILGASILGTGGDEAIHCILTAMYARQPASLIQRSVHIHPTVAELIPTVFGDLKPMS